MSRQKPDPFVVGLTRIALATGKELTEELIGVYRDAIWPQTSPEEWESFCRSAVTSGRWGWFPKVKEILDALAELHGGSRAELIKQADDAYNAVEKAGSYTPAGGTTWNFRDVQAKCGEVAALAFLDAGGPAGFAYGHEDQRYKRFVEAFVREAQRDQRLFGPAPARKELRS